MPRKPAAKKTEPKPTKKKKEVEENIVAPVKDGIEIGNYSTTVYKNGDKISFDIDWDKLREYMRTV
jgi:hypothetical protein